jgi:cytochrome c oxidase assembly factor CtaG
LVSPLHPWGQQLFAAHMAQHELLMIAAAPLLILGRPAPVMLSAFPSRGARRVLGQLRAHGGSQLWGWLTNPLIAWVLHAVALWVWHVPALFQATLDSEWAHAAQHVSFLGTALIFWHAVFHGPKRAMGYGMAVVYLFTTALHSGALGALLTFASELWYPRYAATAPAWGLSALEDQQLGGLIMWVPGGVGYFVAALALAALWIRRSGALAGKGGGHALPAP